MHPDRNTVRTAVVMVNYNNSDDTSACVNSFSELANQPPIIIVDNDSQDNSVTRIGKEHPNLTIIGLDQNVGFGRGINVAVKWALRNTSCEYILVLNNDTLIEPTTLVGLERTLAEHRNVGIAAPRIAFTEKRETLWYGGGEIDWKRGAGTAPGVLGRIDSKMALTPRQIDFASGCAMLVRREVFETIGGFDQRFFMYEEDLEFCLRAMEAGFAIQYVPEALMYHVGQGSLRKDRKEGFVGLWSPNNPRLRFYVYHIVKNRFLNMHIHARGLNALVFYTVFPAILLYKSMRFALHGRWGGIAEIVRGFRDYRVARSQHFINEIAND